MDALDKFDELTLQIDHIGKLLEVIMGLVFRIDDLKIFKNSEKFDLLVQLEVMLQLAMEKNDDLDKVANELWKLFNQESSQRKAA